MVRDFKIVVTSDREGRQKCLERVTRDFSGALKNALYFDLGGGHISVYICKKSLICTIKICAFYCM